MLTATVVDPGAAATPDDLWGAWSADPVVILGLLAGGLMYWRGRRPARHGPVERRRGRCFAAAMAAIGIALLSPLDAASTALASAHMAQHVVLVLVAAPLLALSAPGGAFLRSLPHVARRRLLRLSRAPRVTTHADTPLPWVAAWLLHAGTVWLWHAAVLYDAALQHRVLHAAEHASFLLTALLFWHMVIGPRGHLRVSPGLGLVLIFGMALQSTLLSMLLTFARTPWYSAYAATTRAWGFEPLADQQLAGVIMWIPAGFLYLIAALALVWRWVETDGLRVSPPSTGGIPLNPGPRERCRFEGETGGAKDNRR